MEMLLWSQSCQQGCHKDYRHWVNHPEWCFFTNLFNQGVSSSLEGGPHYIIITPSTFPHFPRMLFTCWDHSFMPPLLDVIGAFTIKTARAPAYDWHARVLSSQGVFWKRSLMLRLHCSLNDHSHLKTDDHKDDIMWVSPWATAWRKGHSLSLFYRLAALQI